MNGRACLGIFTFTFGLFKPALRTEAVCISRVRRVFGGHRKAFGDELLLVGEVRPRLQFQGTASWASVAVF